MMEKNSPVATWSGRVISALIVAILLADAAVNFFAPELLQKEMAAVGFPVEMAPASGAVMLVCALLYAFPATAPLGAILVTGFCGGAISLHLRLGEIGSPPQLVCLLIGVLAWLGLYLRFPRIRSLIPLQSGRAHVMQQRHYTMAVHEMLSARAIARDL